MRFTLIELLIGLIVVLNVFSSVVTVEDSKEKSTPRTDEVTSDWK